MGDGVFAFDDASVNGIFVVFMSCWSTMFARPAPRRQLRPDCGGGIDQTALLGLCLLFQMSEHGGIGPVSIQLEQRLETLFTRSTGVWTA